MSNIQINFTPFCENKFNKLVQNIKIQKEISLDLTDFGIHENQMKLLIDIINFNKNIKILTLSHNNLSDKIVDKIIQLNEIVTLDISHNDLTIHGLKIIFDNLVYKNKNFRLIY